MQSFNITDQLQRLSTCIKYCPMQCTNLNLCNFLFWDHQKMFFYRSKPWNVDMLLINIEQKAYKYLWRNMSNILINFKMQVTQVKLLKRRHLENVPLIIEVIKMHFLYKILLKQHCVIFQINWAMKKNLTCLFYMCVNFYSKYSILNGKSWFMKVLTFFLNTLNVFTHYKVTLLYFIFSFRVE